MLVFMALLKYTSVWIFHQSEIFECPHLKFSVSGWSKQTNIDIHMRAQCSHTSVGLTQARPNYQTTITLHIPYPPISFKVK